MISPGLLPQVATVRRPSFSQRPDLSKDVSFVDVVVGVPCSLQTNEDAARKREGGNRDVGDWFLAIGDPATDILKRDQVEIDGRLFEVVHLEDAAGRGHHLEAELNLETRLQT